MLRSYGSFIILKLILWCMHVSIYFHMYVCLPVSLCALCACSQLAEARGGVTLEVELMVAVCHCVVLGAEPGPLCSLCMCMMEVSAPFMLSRVCNCLQQSQQIQEN